MSTWREDAIRAIGTADDFHIAPREMKRCLGRYRAQPAQRLADWSRRRLKDRKLAQ